MTRLPKWTSRAGEDGITTFRLSSWSWFFEFVENEICTPNQPKSGTYVWRGQRNPDWSLSTTLDRLFGRLDLLTASPRALESRSGDHLEAFKYAARGRRGIAPPSLSENEWWALGQHYGLATPLLDWTRSPFAALYFAFEEPVNEAANFRVVYALSQSAILQKGYELAHGPSYEKGRLPIVEFIDPMSDENQRLVSQGGCFTRAPIGTPIEQWVAKAFEKAEVPALIRIEIPEVDRVACLRALNRMNINHLSLFPDLTGASRSANLKMELDSQ